jgi:hypothetical protein
VNFPSTGVNVPFNGVNGGTEAGGDVGGMVYTYQADGDYIHDTSQTGGIVARRN